MENQMPADTNRDVAPPVNKPVWDTVLKGMAKRNLDQTALAGAIGVNQSTISHWLNRKRTPRKKHIEQLSEALQIPVEKLKKEAATFFFD